MFYDGFSPIMDKQEIDKVIEDMNRMTEGLLFQGKQACIDFLTDAGIITNQKDSLPIPTQQA